MILSSSKLIIFGADEEVIMEIIKRCTEKARLVQKMFNHTSFERNVYPKIISSIARRYSDNKDFRIITEMDNAYEHAYGLRKFVSSSTYDNNLKDLDNYWLNSTELNEILDVVESNWIKGAITRKMKREKGKKGAPPQKLVRGLLVKINEAFHKDIPKEAYPEIDKFVNIVTMKDNFNPNTAKQRIKQRLSDMYNNARPPKGKMIDDYLEKEEWTNLWKDDIKKK